MCHGSKFNSILLLINVIFLHRHLSFFDFVQRGRTIEAEAAFEKLLGGVHVKPAMTELSKSDRGDGSDSVKLSELICGRYFRGT